MAGPWTAGRDRQDSKPGGDMTDLLSRVASLPRRISFRPPGWLRLAGRLSLPRQLRPGEAPGPGEAARPGEAPRPGEAAGAGEAPRPGEAAGPGALPWPDVPAGPRTLVGRAPRAARAEVGTAKAVLILTLITLAAVVVAWAGVSLVGRGLAARDPAARGVAGPLVTPAPRMADQLPRRFGPVSDQDQQRLIDQFGARFYAIGNNLPGPGSAGSAVRPSGLYAEPGHIDPVTGHPSWIMYLGLGTTRSFGAPERTMAVLMSRMLGPDSQIGYWKVSSGARGGIASCTVATLHQVPVSVCAWATRRAVGALMSPQRDTGVRELATIMIKMRFALQTG